MDVSTAVTILAAVGLLVGICGVVVPVLPGLLLCWVSVLAWAIFSDAGGGRWLVFGLVTLIAAVGEFAKYMWPGRRLKQSGVPNKSLVIGGLLGIVGFFVIPIVGLPVGFVLGIWLSEQTRLKDGRSAWASTRHALKAVGLSLLIELAAALTIAGVWVAGVIVA